MNSEPTDSVNENKCALQSICSRAEQMKESSNLEDRNRKVVLSSSNCIKIKQQKEESL